MSQYFQGIPGYVYPTRGATYTADSNGVVTVPSPTGLDILDLINMGLVPTSFSSSETAPFGGTVVGAKFGSFGLSGSLYTLAGDTLGGNGADATDDILGGVVIPAGALDKAGRTLTILATGKTGATTNNKRIKLFINGTLASSSITASVVGNAGTVSAGTAIADSGAWVNGTTANSAKGWSIMVDLIKYGAAGSNTQLAVAAIQTGTLSLGAGVPTAVTLTESGTLTIVVTGSSYTSSAAADVLLSSLQVLANN